MVVECGGDLVREGLRLGSFSVLGLWHLASDLDCFAGLTACCYLLGLFFGQDLMHGHAIDLLKALSLALSLSEATGDQEGCQHDEESVLHGGRLVVDVDGLMPMGGSSSFYSAGGFPGREMRCSRSVLMAFRRSR